MRVGRRKYTRIRNASSWLQRARPRGKEVYVARSIRPEGRGHGARGTGHGRCGSATHENNPDPGLPICNLIREIHAGFPVVAVLFAHVLSAVEGGGRSPPSSWRRWRRVVRRRRRRRRVVRWWRRARRRRGRLAVRVGRLSGARAAVRVQDVADDPDASNRDEHTLVHDPSYRIVGLVV